MDRHTIAGTGEFVASPDDEFMENNCVDDPVRLCDFQLLENRIMKTVDSVYQVLKRKFSIKIWRKYVQIRDSRWMSYEPAAILNQNHAYIPHIIGKVLWQKKLKVALCAV